MSDINNIKLTPKQNLLALFFILVIISSVGLRLFFSDKALAFSGPNFVASSDSTALVVYNTDIFRLNTRGDIKQKIAFADIGLQDKVADIQILDDERFVVGDWSNEKIVLCQFSGLACQDLTSSLGKEIGNFFKFHYRERENDIFIADTDRHRILHYDIASKEIKKISDNKQFIYPNHLQVEKDGYLYITDTNHHRIASFEYKNDKLVQVGEDITIPKEASSNKFPIHYFILDNGDMYVLQGNNFLLYADLVYLPTSGKAENIPLANDADITTASKMGNKLLLSDRVRFTLNSLDLSSHELSEFGSDELKTIFSNEKQATALWDMLSTGMLILMIIAIIGMVGFIIYLSKNGDRHKPEKEQTENSINSNLPPIIPGVLTWLDPDPMVRRLLPALFILLLIMAGLVYAITDMLNLDLNNIKNDSPEQKLVQAAWAMVLILVVVIVNAIHNIYYQIGTDGIYIYIKTVFSKNKIQPQHLLYNKQYLLKGSFAIIYRNNMSRYFHDKEQFETYIIPLLKAFAKEITTTQVLKHMLANPSPLFIFNAVSIGYILYYMISNGILFS